MSPGSLSHLFDTQSVLTLHAAQFGAFVGVAVTLIVAVGSETQEQTEDEALPAAHLPPPPVAMPVVPKAQTSFQFLEAHAVTDPAGHAPDLSCSDV